jgi:hypothetical protein
LSALIPMRVIEAATPSGLRGPYRRLASERLTSAIYSAA